MSMRVSAALLLATASPLCGAYVMCAQVDPGAPQYRGLIGQIAREAGLDSRFSQYDEQVVLNFCGNRPDRIDDLIDQGRVTAREATAIKKALVATSAPKDRPTAAASASPEKVSIRRPTPEEAAAIDRVIDDLFVRWSLNWFTDRYVKVSSHIAEMSPTPTGYIVRGQFDFRRGGALNTIPFAAAINKNGNAYAVANLCYNDTTSGMTDCTASGQSSASSRLMGAVIIGGLIAGMNGSPSEGSAQKTCETKIRYGEPGQSGYDRSSGGIPYEVCR